MENSNSSSTVPPSSDANEKKTVRPLNQANIGENAQVGQVAVGQDVNQTIIENQTVYNNSALPVRAWLVPIGLVTGLLICIFLGVAGWVVANRSDVSALFVMPKPTTQSDAATTTPAQFTRSTLPATHSFCATGVRPAYMPRVVLAHAAGDSSDLQIVQDDIAVEDTIHLLVSLQDVPDPIPFRAVWFANVETANPILLKEEIQTVQGSHQVDFDQRPESGRWDENSYCVELYADGALAWSKRFRATALPPTQSAQIASLTPTPKLKKNPTFGAPTATPVIKDCLLPWAADQPLPTQVSSSKNPFVTVNARVLYFDGAPVANTLVATDKSGTTQTDVNGNLTLNVRLRPGVQLTVLVPPNRPTYVIDATQDVQVTLCVPR